jgi:hypothetical protein
MVLYANAIRIVAKEASAIVNLDVCICKRYWNVCISHFNLNYIEEIHAGTDLGWAQWNLSRFECNKRAHIISSPPHFLHCWVLHCSLWRMKPKIKPVFGPTQTFLPQCIWIYLVNVNDVNLIYSIFPSIY